MYFIVTDVAGSICGYYKQIYVAVQALLNLKDEKSEVGIECGADVRIFHPNNNRESIEVKFYKSRIGSYSKEISKTIYNFYWNSYNDVKLSFNSNTKTPYFGIWNQNNNKVFSGSDFKKEFVLHSLIKHNLNIKAENKKKISAYFKQVGITCNKCESFCCDSCISDFVKSNIHSYPYAFKNIIDINKNVNIEEFSSKIQFEFEDRDKVESITVIKNNLIKLLKENFSEYTYKLNDIILEAIIQKIAICFFDTTVFNSILLNEDNFDYNGNKKLTRKDVIEFINNYEEFLDEYKNDVLELRIIELVDKENLNKEKIIFKFNQEYNEYIISKNYIDVYDLCSIKEYFKKINMKFRSEDERNEVAERFLLYNSGLGIIGYLITLKISEIMVYEDRLFVESDFHKKLFIENKDYYDFNLVSQYAYDNKRSEDDFFQYTKVGDLSLLKSISECCTTPFIKINKVSKAITLDEYQKINNIPSKTIDKLRNILCSKYNLLIISRADMNRIPFFNALISSIPNSLELLIVAEDISTSPSNYKNNTIMYIDSIKKDYESKINSLMLTIGNYDKCIALIDNYELDINKIYRHCKLFLENANCLITTVHRNTIGLDDSRTFEKVNQNLFGYNNVDFSMFDYFIIIDNCYVEGTKQDVVKIIGK